MLVLQKLRLMTVDKKRPILNKLSGFGGILTLKDMLTTFVVEGVPGVHGTNKPRSHHVTGLFDAHQGVLEPGVDDWRHVLLDCERSDGWEFFEVAFDVSIFFEIEIMTEL